MGKMSCFRGNCSCPLMSRNCLTFQGKGKYSWTGSKCDVSLCLVPENNFICHNLRPVITAGDCEIKACSGRKLINLRQVQQMKEILKLNSELMTLTNILPVLANVLHLRFPYCFPKFSMLLWELEPVIWHPCSLVTRDWTTAYFLLTKSLESSCEERNLLKRLYSF